METVTIENENSTTDKENSDAVESKSTTDAVESNTNEVVENKSIDFVEKYTAEVIQNKIPDPVQIKSKVLIRKKSSDHTRQKSSDHIHKINDIARQKSSDHIHKINDIAHKESNDQANTISRKNILEKHFLFLQLLNEKNKSKKEEKKLKEIKFEKIKEKHKEHLGLNKVKSKILENYGREDNVILPNIVQTPKSLSLQKDKDNQSIKKKNKKNKSKKEKENSIESKTVPALREKIKEKVIFREKSRNNIINLKNCNSLADWKRRNRIENDKNVFICFSGYPDMKKALLNRGWVENTDPESFFYDFKYMLSGRNLVYEKLLKNQLVNHFEHNGELTRKGSLCKNLKNLVWFRNINVDSFYPRCYNLNETIDLEIFIEDFKMTKAESIIKDYLEDKRQIKDKILLTSLQICERKLKDINEIIDFKGENIAISSKEWDIICEEVEQTTTEDNNNENKRSKSSSMRTFGTNPINNTNSVFNDIKVTGGNVKRIKRTEKDSVKNSETHKEKVRKVLDKMSKRETQYYLNGSRNIWIMKPSGLSRGRGIKCVSTLSETLLQIKSGCNQYVIQKYIENPMIILNKKFDIRQWVLVSNFNPLTIWLYDEPYIRFGAENYNPENISNLYSHLTNNAIAVKSKKFECSGIEENMWDVNTFAEYLKAYYHEDVYENKIKQKLKEIIIFTLESVQDVIINRKNSHEVYGFDLMIDDQFNVWLIEVNSSPCMEYSTQITKRLVKLVMEDICKVVVDKKKDDADTGLWKLIHKGKYVEETTVPVGFNLVCEGVKFEPSEEN